jgi:hypothetical protein
MSDNFELTVSLQLAVPDPGHIALHLAEKAKLKVSALTHRWRPYFLRRRHTTLATGLSKAFESDTARASFPKIDGTFKSAPSCKTPARSE